MNRAIRSLLLVVVAVLACIPSVLPGTADGARSPAPTITLTYYHHTFPIVNNMEAQYIKQFEAMNPGVTIKMTILPDTDLFAKFLAATAAGSPPDIVELVDTYAPELYQRQQMAPVDLAAVGATSLAQLEQRYIPGALDGYTFGGKLYALPDELSDYVMWVNAQSLKAAGLSANGYPRTWEQMAAVGKKLTKVVGGKTIKEAIALPFNFPVGEFLVLDALARQAGGSLFSADGKKAYLDSPAVVKAVTALASLVQPDKISDPALNGPTAGADRTLFGNGVAAMMLTGGTWYRSVLSSTYQKVNAVATAVPYPRFAGGSNSAGDLYGSGLVVDAHSAHQALAWKFVAFMLSHGSAYFQKAGIFLGDKATVNSSVATSFPNWSTFAAELAHGHYAPRLNNFAQIADIVGRGIDSVIENHQDPATVLSSLQTDVTPLLNS
jgi:multiple sugar transport system substrate-binding protein